MADKILVADDSLTIQKVVAITLANEPWVIVEATDESELFGKLRGGDYNLVLLDFNLSESKSGYELVQEIKSLSPHVKVLAMLGTFDSIDESQLDQSGADGKIVKPFDSSKFIQKCRELINASDSVDLSTEEEESLAFNDQEAAEEVEEDQNTETSFEDDSEGWVMDSPSVSQSEVEEDDSLADTWDEETSPGISMDSISSNESKHEDKLMNELQGWGVSIPDPIGASKEKAQQVPPVIGGGTSSSDMEKDFLWDDDSDSSNASSEEISFSVDEQVDHPVIGSIGDEDDVYPETDDLDYPDFGSLSEISDFEGVSSKPAPQMISLDQLSPEEDEMPLQIVREDEPIRDELAKEIEDELSPDDFWAADDSTATELPTQKYSDDEDDDSRESFVVGVGDPLAPIEPIKPSEKLNVEISQQKNFQPALDEDAVVRRVTEALAPMIEDIVKRYMEEKVEKVAWEIIPDVAENLIRKEIKELSQSTRNS